MEEEEVCEITVEAKNKSENFHVAPDSIKNKYQLALVSACVAGCWLTGAAGDNIGAKEVQR